MEYLSTKEYAALHGLAERTVRNYCMRGKIEMAMQVGKSWNIPANAPLPQRKNARVHLSPLLTTLKNEKEARRKGGIYHRTQIDLSYNSNHMEGSQLSKEQTRYIFETNTIGLNKDPINVDDIIETTNHFRCLDYIIDHAKEPLSEGMIKELHRMLKANTSDANKAWFNVDEYKRLPNEVGGVETVAPKEVRMAMKTLLSAYKAYKEISLKHILDFHVQFERIHPFQDGNGRVGRLIMFKECLCHDIVPFIITDELKMFYYRGLHEWSRIPEFLTDTCLTAQDHYKQALNYFEIKYRE